MGLLDVVCIFIFSMIAGYDNILVRGYFCNVFYISNGVSLKPRYFFI
jgi:hypothetical protein